MTSTTETSGATDAKPLPAFADSEGRKRKGRERDFEARKKLFGYPQLLQGEDDATYSELLSRFRAAINPVDIIDEMYVADVVSLEWDVLRWRRLKTSLMRMRGVKELQKFLLAHLPYDQVQKRVEEDLLEILQEECEDQTQAKLLARKCADFDEAAVQVVRMILERIELDLTEVRSQARDRKVEELAQDYTGRKPDAIELIDQLLGSTGSCIDAIMVTAISEDMDKIDRINRLAAIAETRRNSALREIDRRHVALARTVRRQVQEVEAEYEVIDTTPAVRRASRDQ